MKNKLTLIALGVVLLAGPLVARTVLVPAYGQCGGLNYTGPTTCVEGYTCVKAAGDYYYQCQPATLKAKKSAKANTKLKAKK